ncbi:MAG TPA: PLP-dependent aspartate aminotransferase family protein [Candidatus Thermoplasmatota archaeon]|nr:PLP-dependent aspartate aminotransferase family protein [Candidatus Thermoplasmatota archaeon]
MPKTPAKRSRAKPAPEHAFETRLIHAGQAPDPSTGAVVTPIHPTTTYAQASLGVTKGFDYSRAGNPTRKALEDCFASLENATRAFAFASGMSGIVTVAHLLSAGDHVVCEENVYGGTIRYFSKVASRFGLSFDYVDASDPKNVERAMRPETKMVYLETPTNPNLKLNDIEALATIARRAGALTVVDSTFASPYITRPLDLGADVVLHSATKYIGGHSDVLAGLVAVKDEDLAERLAFLSKSIGPVLSPFDAWLLLRGLKTLHVRMEAHSANATAIATRLEKHPKVARVNYPGLASHPQRALAKRQMRLPSGMLSFELKGGFKAATRAMESVRLWTLAESLGAVESLVSHPASMTHASVPAKQRRKAGVTDGLVRLSVGLENPDDLWADLERALAKA